MRNAIVALLKLGNIKYNNSKSQIEKSVAKKENEDRYNEIVKIYPRIDIDKIGNIIRNAEKEFAFFMPEEHYNSMFTHLTISIGRLLKGIKVDDESDLIDGQCNDIETQVARYIVAKLEEEFNISIPQAEFAYICMHLMGLNIYSGTDRMDIDDALLSIPSNVKTLVYEIVRHVGNILNEDFTDDKILLLGLMFYLKTSVFRLKNNANTGFLEVINMLAYYLIFQMESDDTLLAKYRVGIDAWWNSIKYSENPLWYYIYQLAYLETQLTDAYGNNLIDTASWALKRHPVDTITWKAYTVGRPGVEQVGELSKDEEGNITVIPQDERRLHKFNGSMYELEGGDSNNMEGSTTYTLPYWLGRYHDMID